MAALLLNFNPMIYFVMLSRILIASSTSSWLILWVAIEINLFAFAPLIIKSPSNLETERGVKYFILQTLTSIILLILLINKAYGLYGVSITINHHATFFTILIKLGIAPCHIWYPAVINSISWINCLLLSTIQKIIPLLALIYFINYKDPYILFSIITLNSLLGGWGTLNQTQIRPIISYSSINHISWVLAANTISTNITIIYFSSYIIISFSLFYAFHKTNQLFISNVSTLTFINHRPITFFNLLSLGGLPPLFGFYPKIIILTSLFPFQPITALILILGSLICLYYYRLIIINTIISTPTRFSNNKWQFTFLFIISIFVGPILLIL